MILPALLFSVVSKTFRGYSRQLSRPGLVPVFGYQDIEPIEVDRLSNSWVAITTWSREFTQNLTRFTAARVETARIKVFFAKLILGLGSS